MPAPTLRRGFGIHGGGGGSGGSTILIGGVGLPFSSVAGARARNGRWTMLALHKANRPPRQGTEMVHYGTTPEK
jgi:hypothetical protein